jgi:hypothetical protein
MGAVAMLLVASIMVVSSTYAWFTLSTAPEITGISTSVGANGNLEIALLNNDTGGDLNSITSAVGDSSEVKAVTAANITWGNLVDLSDASYGTNLFVLNPARLNLTSENVLSRAASLLTAKYGADGRVTELAANTLSGLYNSGIFAGGTGDQYGVRGIGVAAGMSEQQIAFRNARIMAASKLSSASNSMTTALSTNGAALVNTIIAYANSGSSYTATADDIAALNNIITAVGTAKTNIGDAINYAKYAYELQTDANAAEPTAGTTPAKYTGEGLGTFQTAVNAAIDGYEAITVPTALVGENPEKAAITTAVDALINRENCTVGGKDYAELSSMETNDLMDWGIANINNIVVVMNGENTGALAKVAKASANYSAAVSIPGLTVPMGGGTPITIGSQTNPIHATLRTDISNSSLTSAAMSAATLALTAPASTGDAANNITDLYGYAVDFAVRTNAADSKLLLQTDEAQRIYGGGSVNEDTTQGGGSYMEFTKNSGLNDTQFAALIDAIRVVFVDGSNNILAVAVPDVGTISSATVKAPLKLVNYGVVFDSENTANNGMIKIGAELDEPGAETPTAKFKTGDAERVIMNLNQNEATKLTALVYLDGDVVDNSMVSAIDAQSMTGSLNLQFASSAQLKPMEYTPLMSSDSTPAVTP